MLRICMLHAICIMQMLHMHATMPAIGKTEWTAMHQHQLHGWTLRALASNGPACMCAYAGVCALTSKHFGTEGPAVQAAAADTCMKLWSGEVAA